MAIRKVIFNVSASGVTPAGYQWGGVQNEDNATEINFIIDEEYLSLINEGGGQIRFRIDFASALAGYQPSENLLLSENSVKRSIPKAITQYGGEISSNLVITRFFDNGDSEEILTVPATLFFTASSRQDERVNGNLSAFEENILKKAEEAKNSALSANAALDTIEQKLASGEFKGEKGEKGEKGDKGDKGDTYTLTEEDKTRIANLVLENFVDVSEVGQ